MYADIDMNEFRGYIINKYTAEGDFTFLKEGELDEMVDTMIAIDNKYMADSGADDGEVYDDDAAYELIFAGMNEKYPQYKMYLMRFCDDYLDFAEEYLASIDAIEWE